ncbi:MAG: hypothetical protein NDJ90_10985 [Oligoflexia bacterium]|nr:hypothetical protein [Oligoflexia bacterium]
MKKLALLALLVGSFAQASDMRQFTNLDGCRVDLEKRGNGDVLYVSHDGQEAIIGVTSDRREGTIAGYCDEPNVVSFGTGVNLLCNAHQNGDYVTRGSAEIDFRNGLTAVTVEGQVKRMFGWKTDLQIDCQNLVERR